MEDDIILRIVGHSHRTRGGRLLDQAVGSTSSAWGQRGWNEFLYRSDGGLVRVAASRASGSDMALVRPLEVKPTAMSYHVLTFSSLVITMSALGRNLSLRRITRCGFRVSERF